MANTDSNYQIVYRGETLPRLVEGGWVFFQRAKVYGGGFWFGRTYSDGYWLEFDHPCSLREGLEYLSALNSMVRFADEVDDNFRLG